MTFVDRWVSRLPIVAGPLAMAGFALPWITGSGPLAGRSYSGLELVTLSGAIQGADLSGQGEALAGLLRLLIIGVPVAAVWVTLLAPAGRWHWAYPVSAVYLVVSAIIVASLGTMIAGHGVPLPGTALMLAAALVLVGPLVARIRWRPRGSAAEIVLIPASTPTN